MTTQFHSLLGDLSLVPPDYIRDVAHIKRFLERWTMDPKYQEAFASDAQAALKAINLTLTPADVIPLIVPEQATAVTRLVRAGRADEVPVSVLRYRFFIHEKIQHRRQLRTETVPADPRMRAWRDQMISRCTGELGAERSDAIVHAPAAFELSQGCTVGCWFCGVAAPKFERNWPHTPDNAKLWRDCLAVVGEVFGPSAKHGFMYWATDPLDNPDYEHFLTDFYEVLGKCPQTTTAQEWAKRQALAAGISYWAVHGFARLMTRPRCSRIMTSATARVPCRLRCGGGRTSCGSAGLALAVRDAGSWRRTVDAARRAHPAPGSQRRGPRPRVLQLEAATRAGR